jgi:hypothetical protein
MINFYNKIITKFESEEVLNSFEEDNISPPKQIGMYMRQDLDPNNLDLFEDNFLFIDWKVDHSIDYPIATISFRLPYKQLRDISNPVNRDFEVNFLKYVNKVREILTEFETDTTGKLEFIEEKFSRKKTVVDTYVLKFECSYIGIKKQEDELGTYEELYLSSTKFYNPLHS